MPPAYPRLVGRDTSTEGFRFAKQPFAERTIGNYWPYATTVFDYVRRAMPPPPARFIASDSRSSLRRSSYANLAVGSNVNRTTVITLACALLAIACGSADEPTDPGASSGGLTGVPGTFPTLPNYGGHTLSQMRLVVIVPLNDSFRDQIFAFADSLVISQWWKQASSGYGVTALPSVAKVTGAPMFNGGLQANDMLAYIAASIGGSPSLAPNGQTMYMLYLPTGITFAAGNACNGESGFHRTYGTFGDAWGVAERCPSSPTIFDDLTMLSSHEIIEAATDPALNAWTLAFVPVPWNGSPWARDDFGAADENADVCEGTRYREGPFMYQRILTNAAVAAGGDPCVPALTMPYYTVKTNAWSQGRTVVIPITGWSTAPTSDWALGATVVTTEGSFTPSLHFAGPDTLTYPNGRWIAMNNGRVATLTVSFPATAQSGTFAVIELYSFREDPLTGATPPNEDFNHKWVTGVYIP